VIGGEAVVRVLGIGISQVRIGIEASKNVEVHQEEMVERIDALQLQV